MVALTQINGQTLESTTALGRVCVAAELAGVSIERATITGHHLEVQVADRGDASHVTRALLIDNELINAGGWNLDADSAGARFTNEHGVVLTLRHRL